MTETKEFVTLIADDKYEINVNYPHEIRKKSNGKPVRESVRKDGYVDVSLNGRKYLKHRLIAQQWIPNPDDLPQIDHKNRDKLDNRIKNLRWVTQSENQLNRSSHFRIDYNYIDELPIGSRPLILYNGHELEGYSFDKDFNVYKCNTIEFRILHVHTKAGKYPFVRCHSINGKCIDVYISKLRDGTYE